MICIHRQRTTHNAEEHGEENTDAKGKLDEAVSGLIASQMPLPRFHRASHVIESLQHLHLCQYAARILA